MLLRTLADYDKAAAIMKPYLEKASTSFQITDEVCG
jgi:hypothetical protein